MIKKIKNLMDIYNKIDKLFYKIYKKKKIFIDTFYFGKNENQLELIDKQGNSLILTYVIKKIGGEKNE